MKIILCIAVLMLVFMSIRCMYRRERRIKRIFVGGNDISVSEVVMFSNEELVERIKSYYKGVSKKLRIYYSQNDYIELDTKNSKTFLISKLRKLQPDIIMHKYSYECEMGDAIDRLMFNIWLENAKNSNYESLFWKEIDSKLVNQEISNTTYNQIYKRFYKFDINND